MPLLDDELLREPMAGIRVSSSRLGLSPSKAVGSTGRDQHYYIITSAHISRALERSRQGMNLELWRMFSRRPPCAWWHKAWAIPTGQGKRSDQPSKRPHADHPSPRPPAWMAPAGSRGVTGAAHRSIHSIASPENCKDAVWGDKRVLWRPCE